MNNLSAKEAEEETSEEAQNEQNTKHNQFRLQFDNLGCCDCKQNPCKWYTYMDKENAFFDAVYKPVNDNLARPLLKCLNRKN